MPGEMSALLERCRAGESVAWERFTAWVKGRGRVILGSVDRLSGADAEDAVADALHGLVTVVRRGEIRGDTNAEIDAYVCTAIRNRALNALRGRGRRREVDPGALDMADPAPAQDAQAVAAEQLDRAEKVLHSWSAEDRYVFLAKLNGVSAALIQQTLERPPFRHFTAVATIDNRFHRLRKRLIEELGHP